MQREKLIEEVRKYPYLCDLSDSKYNDNIKKDEAWKEISITLNQSVFFEPTDTRKAVRPLQFCNLTYASPNLAELKAMVHFLKPGQDFKTVGKDELEKIVELATDVTSIRNLIVTLGSNGVLVVENSSKEVYYYPTDVIDNIVNVSGAGDCFSGGFIHGVLSGMERSDCVAMGFQAAKAALASKQTVPNSLTIDNNVHSTFVKLK